jgi:hypothetical protein
MAMRASLVAGPDRKKNLEVGPTRFRLNPFTHPEGTLLRAALRAFDAADLNQDRRGDLGHSRRARRVALFRLLGT